MIGKMRFILLVLIFSFSAYVWAEPDSGEVVTGSSLEVPNISDIIEAVGTVVYSTAAVYTSPDKTSKVIRYAIPGEKVIITASDEIWYCVRMFNGKTGFIEKKNLKTSKIFYEESVTKNYMDKRISVELQELVKKFNHALSISVYLEKYQIVPKLNILNSAKNQNIITLTMEYSAVDRTGGTVPSRQENMLALEMRRFIELLFMKMLPAQADAYKIVFSTPVFSETGQVSNTHKAYAELVLVHEDVDIYEIRYGEEEIFDLLECSIDKEDLFKYFPH